MAEEVKSFTEKLKANSSNLYHMSATVENPTIPLIGLKNGAPNYTQSQSDDTRTAYQQDSETDPEKGVLHPDTKAQKGKKKWKQFKQTKYENVGERLAQRKSLFKKRRNISDIAFITSLVGIILMLIHTELILDEVYTNSDPAAIALKVFITLSTVDLLGMLAWYHVIDLKLYMIDNGMEDWLLALSPRNAFFIILELTVCAIHPIPGDISFLWQSRDFSLPESSTITVPLDVVLSIPMFLRLYLLCRVMLLHSKLFADARSQSLGALNKTKFNFYFIFKSLMYLHPAYVLVVIVSSIFLVGAWALRICEIDHDELHRNYWNSLWLVAITFLSVGYGDVVPHTYCGKAIAVTSGILGATCTALVVAVLAQKLELSRAEKYVHNFVIDVELDKSMKDSAQRILTFAWRTFRGRKRGESESEIRGHQRKLLKAINEIRKSKTEQRKMVDSQVTVLEVYKNQAFISDSVENIIAKQEELEKGLGNVTDQVGHIGNKLDELCRIMSSRRDRRETRREYTGAEGGDYM